MSQNFELSSLYDYICRALTFTEAVRATLEFECAEAKFALKPWHIKTVITKEIDKNTCICDEISSENEAETISEEIGRAILQAQKLRETLSYNILKQEKNIKEPNLRNIYASKVLSLDKTKLHNTDYKSCKIRTAKSSIKPKIKPNNDTKETQNVIKTVSTSTTNKTTQALSKNKKVSDINVTAADTKQKGKKNFLVTNKLNIKKIKPTRAYNDKKKEEIRNNPSFNNSKIKQVVCAASTSELTKLIEKISSSSFKKMSMSSINTSCPLHGENGAEFIEEVGIQSLSIVDALYKLDIPKDILKVLRKYHSYLRFERTKKTVNTLQHQKATSFLKEFDKMNETTQGYFVSDNILNLTMQSISVFEKVYSGIIQDEQITNLEKELESFYKIHKIKEFYTDSIKNAELLNTPLKYSEIAGWISNGIWNSTCIEDLHGISKICCIKYNNLTQLSSFLTILQQFQQTKYFNTIIEILLHDVIPKTIHFFKPTDAAYLQIYKMVNILSQGLNPKSPVFVKTED